MSLEDLCCGARPKNAERTGENPFKKPLSDGDAAKEVDEEEEEVEELGFAGRALSIFGGKKEPKKANGAAKKPALSPTKEDEEDFGTRAISFFSFGGKDKDSKGLPPNWKRIKDKEVC